MLSTRPHGPSAKPSHGWLTRKRREAGVTRPRAQSVSPGTLLTGVAVPRDLHRAGVDRRAGGHVERLQVLAAERRVRGLLGELDRAEHLPARVEHLQAGTGGDVDVARRIDRPAV